MYIPSTTVGCTDKTFAMYTLFGQVQLRIPLIYSSILTRLHPWTVLPICTNCGACKEQDPLLADAAEPMRPSGG